MWASKTETRSSDPQPGTAKAVPVPPAEASDLSVITAMMDLHTHADRVLALLLQLETRLEPLLNMDIDGPNLATLDSKGGSEIDRRAVSAHNVLTSAETVIERINMRL